ncbi:alpha-glucosidase [Parashewanella spongiae]|uniref:Alpha-glucosidase n=1 Tax=Parashewanella spongiae TaxID=342950 RepID=A0A3A6U3X8_9GAMM|nr:alpha-amylase family glycosyl hydrolase [Parashewanella spongiae]MCL1079111.1 alpha-glucosidase [Parashewanella spongiae]RJY10730.1 alpha-glucosidase [Parashewanella spongiae]
MNDLDWWRGAIIYQIYPRSFKDSTGNGVGDLKGVIEKVPYIANLGVDAIWLSPFFTSPMKDFGYDVSDYKNVDPTFGTLQDFQQLITEAHKSGIKVIIDQVLSHTSEQHAWFEESKQCKSNAKADWYVWADPKTDGTAPNNWLSFFGGSAWTYDTKRGQYYLHNFLSSQPDLNYHNPQVQNAVLDVLRFWLELGVDGFRLDTVNMYFCDKLLRNNPPKDPNVPIQGMNSSNPRAYQSQIYNVNRPQNAEFLNRIRSLMNEYDARTTLGEIGSVQDTIGMMANYTRGTNKLHMCYTADLLAEQKSASFVQQVVSNIDSNIGDGWPCWSLGNHDAVRFATRWGTGVKDKQAFNKAMLSMVVSLKGSICIYQGEELGLEEANVPFEKLVDPFGIAFWPDYKGRDGCRTPMVWDNSESAGFSTTDDTWLPIAPEHKSNAANTQLVDANSVLNYFKEFLSIRKQHPALIKGDIEFLRTASDVLSFKRILDDDVCFVFINMSEQEKELELEELSTLKRSFGTVNIKNNKLTLKPWQVLIAKSK